MLWNASSSRRELHHHRYQHSPSFSTLPNCYKELLRSHNFHSPESIKFLRSELLRNHVLTHFKERKLEGSKSNVSNQVPPEASPGVGGAAKRPQELQQRHNVVDGHLLFRAPAWSQSPGNWFPSPPATKLKATAWQHPGLTDTWLCATLKSRQHALQQTERQVSGKALPLLSPQLTWTAMSLHTVLKNKHFHLGLIELNLTRWGSAGTPPSLSTVQFVEWWAACLKS